MKAILILVAVVSCFSLTGCPSVAVVDDGHRSSVRRHGNHDYDSGYRRSGYYDNRRTGYSNGYRDSRGYSTRRTTYRY